jgi:Nitroreductase family
MKARIAAAIERRYGEELRLSGDLPGLDALAVLNERSVCRGYRPDPVPDELVRLLCATALAAPTKSDLQQATIVRLADPAKRAAVCALLPGSPWLARAPELFVFCADGWRLRRLFEAPHAIPQRAPRRLLQRDGGRCDRARRLRQRRRAGGPRRLPDQRAPKPRRAHRRAARAPRRCIPIATTPPRASASSPPTTPAAVATGAATRSANTAPSGAPTSARTSGARNTGWIDRY